MKTKILPLVSIVIPTYNHANYLSKALQSIVDQTYTNWEAIIIDNHSSDDTEKLINQYSDPRIKYFKIHNFGVIAKSRNEGIKAAKGDWIAFLDSDDWWTPNKLKKCMDYSNNQIDFIYHQLEIVSSKWRMFGRKKVKTRKLIKPIFIDLLFAGNAICNSSVIVRKQMLKKIGLIDESKELVGSEDYNTWIKISILTNQFLYIPKRLGFYFIHDKNFSNKNMSYSYREATNKFLSTLNKKQKIKLESNIRYLSGRFNYLKFNYDQAKKDLLYSLFNGFLSVRIKALFMLFVIFFR